MTIWQDTVAALPDLLQREAQLALNNLLEGCDTTQTAIVAALVETPAFAQPLAKLFACSAFAAQLCRRYPQWLIALQHSNDFNRSLTVDEFKKRLQVQVQNCEATDELDSALRQFRNREYLRIIWRDLNRCADTIETTADISAVAEVTIQAALEFHYRQLQRDWGQPLSGSDGSVQPFIVIGMGKLGARELNLSSDVDLIFAYPEGGETRIGENAGGTRSVSNQEFFIRLGQLVIKSLDQTTADGFVFRVDMRLRPYGESGALVLNFDAFEEYYQDQGRDWERYAMIKARVVAESHGGASSAENFPAGTQLLEMLRPFTYRRYLDYSAFESLREMKGLIQRDVQRRRLHDNIKLGAGGIREIEFIAQCFQLIRGGREPRLQQRQLLRVLELLHELQYLPITATNELRAAYLFLRDTEHAIQAWLDQQTQNLPTADLPRSALAHAMNCANWDAFLQQLEMHRNNVSAHFKNIIAPQENQKSDVADADIAQWKELWLGADIDVEQAEKILIHFDASAEVARRIVELRTRKQVKVLEAVARTRLDTFMPRLFAALAKTEKPGTTFLRILPLIESVLRRTAYFVLLNENPAALRELINLCAASSWVAEQLAKHPALLDELLNAEKLYTAPNKASLQNDLRQQLLRFDYGDLEGLMDALRYFKLAHSLRVIASEIAGTLPLMKVSDYLTWIAETIIEYVLEMAWQQLVSKHGEPRNADGSTCGKQFIVIAYGKFGGIELSHSSDLDLVFIHGTDPNQTTNGIAEIDNGTFFTRLGQRMIHILSAQTMLGALYEVDMRLRPSGNSGLLVTTLNAFVNYQNTQAWTWEHQALVRARVVAGDDALSNEFSKARHDILCRTRDIEKLRADVVGMRQKMRTQLRPHGTETVENPVFDLKQGSGAIVDIEFIVQFAVLAWAHSHTALTQWTDNIRILETLQAEQLIDAATATRIIDAYKTYRSVVHRRGLQHESGSVPMQDFYEQRQTVLAAWQLLLGETQLGETQPATPS